MDNTDVLRLYKQGRSIDYIVNEYYKSKRKDNKLINLATRRIIVIDNCVKKRDVRGEVYKIIYNSFHKS